MAKVSTLSPADKNSASDIVSGAQFLAREQAGSTCRMTEGRMEEENLNDRDSDEALESRSSLDNERKCLATGVCYPKIRMIRFVLGPDATVYPDLAQKLPGRGLWVLADRAALDLAIRKNLFSKAAKTKAIVPPDLAAQVEKLLAKRCLDLLGLARGSGAVITGQPQVEEAVKTGSISYVLLADNAGVDCRKKLAAGRLVPSGFSKSELAAALGREYLAAVGLRPHVLATKLRREIERWQAIRPVCSDTVDQENKSFLNNDDCERT